MSEFSSGILSVFLVIAAFMTSCSEPSHESASPQVRYVSD